MFETIITLFIGWCLGVIPSLYIYYRKRRLTLINSSECLKKILIRHSISNELQNQGVYETVLGLYNLEDETWRTKLPTITPLLLPNNFNKIIDSIDEFDPVLAELFRTIEDINKKLDVHYKSMAIILQNKQLIPERPKVLYCDLLLTQKKIIHESRRRLRRYYFINNIIVVIYKFLVKISRTFLSMSYCKSLLETIIIDNNELREFKKKVFPDDPS